jgi:hypothetical protein
MARWFNPGCPESAQMTPEEFAVRQRIVAVIAKHTREMEGYSYFSSNPGVSEDDYEDIADDIMIEFGIKG